MTFSSRRSRIRRMGALLAAGSALLLVPALTAAVTATPSAGTSPPAPGSIITWGYNGDGNLGIGNTTQSLTAVQPNLPAGTVITAVASGHLATYALTSKGTGYAWGLNDFGALGIGVSTGPDTCGTDACSKSPAPMDFPAGTVVTQMAGGESFGVAATSGGAAYAWGYNGYGDLGNGSTTNSDVPTLVHLPAGAFVTAVAAGHDTGYALTSTGAIWAWGLNAWGQLGNGINTGPTTCDGSNGVVSGTHPCATTPVAVQLPAGVTATGISAGAYNGLALTSSGSALAWGRNDFGQLGNGTDAASGTCTPTCSSVPAAVDLPSGVIATSVVGGHFTGQVTTTTGQVYAWGLNDQGQLGNGESTGPDNCAGAPCGMTPATVHFPTGVKVVQVSGSGYHWLALTSTGVAYAWGYNQNGELGLGSATGPDMCGGAQCSTAPVVVTNVPSGASLISVIAGNYFSMLLTAPPQAYNLVGSDGGVFVFPLGAPGFFGSLPGLKVSVHNVVGIVPTGNYTGYDLVGSDGGVFVFPTGQPTGFFGSLPGLKVTVNNIVGIVPTNHFTGYNLVGSDGGVFVFPTGQATGFFGSLPGLGVHVNNIVGIVSAPGGTGYFLVGSDGGVFSFGRAPFLGSLPGLGISVNNIVGIATTTNGRGYYLVGSNGAVYAFGDAQSFGSLPGENMSVNDIKSIVPTTTGRGYWLIGADGNVYPFGDATAQGNLPALGIHVTNIVGAVPTV